MKMKSDKLFLCLISVGLWCFTLMGCQWLNLQNSVGDWGKSRSFMHAGDSAMKTGQYEIAIEQFQQAAELTPDDPVIFERLSESNWELGYQTLAINQMARAVPGRTALERGEHGLCPLSGRSRYCSSRSQTVHPGPLTRTVCPLTGGTGGISPRSRATALAC